MVRVAGGAFTAVAGNDGEGGGNGRDGNSQLRIPTRRQPDVTGVQRWIVNRVANSV